MLLHLSTALALAIAVPTEAGGPAWQAPLQGSITVLRPFAPPPSPWAAGHRGVDLAAEPGDPVLAAGEGRVAFAGPVAGRGVVVVAHSGGLRTSYEPVEAEVRTGQPLTRGAPLGALGRSAHCPGACLHWGLRRGADYLDPMSLLGERSPGEIRLLPLEGLSAGRPAWCAGRASPSSGSDRSGSPRRRCARPPRRG